MISEPWILVLACTLDALIGDPRWLPHPVVYVGRLIERAEAHIRFNMNNLRAGGAVLALIVTGTTFALTYLTWKALMGVPADGRFGPLAAAVIVYLTSTTIAARGLLSSVSEVLYEEDTEEARRSLSLIVGRDTGDLDRAAIDRAALETLSENLSDGVVAPLLYFAIGGLPLAMLYKAINTLDSMVGYDNEKYRELGWASARLDDTANYIPARISGLLIALASYFVRGADPARALRIMKTYGGHHKSPNSGRPEAALAGALGIVLGGPSNYGGIRVEKPFIGEAAETPAPEPGHTALRLITVTSFIAMALAAAGTALRSAL